MKIEFTRGPGIVVGSLLSWCEKLAGCFSRGAVCETMTDDSRMEEQLDSSIVSTAVIDRVTRNRGVVRRIRHAVAHQFEGSLLMGVFGAFVSFLLTISARVYGSFFVTYGAYVSLIYLIKMFIIKSTVPFSVLVCGLTVTLAATPLLFSSKSLAQLLNESGASKALLTKVFGIPIEKLNVGRSHGGVQSIAVILGIACGMITYFISPFYILFLTVIPAAATLILAYPEGGVVILVAIAPFMGLMPAPSITLGGFTLVTCLGFGIKFVRGKRTLTMGFADVCVFFLWLALLLSGFSPAPYALRTAALTVGLMVVYFLAVNLIREKHWLELCFFAMIFSAAVTAAVGIAAYFFESVSGGWIDRELFPRITARATSTFDNPNVLAVYLIMAFPLALSVLFTRKRKEVKLASGISAVLIFLCVILTWSRGAWIGMLCGAFLMLVAVNAKNVAMIIPLAGGAALAGVIFPDTFGKRLVNIFTLTDSANYYRMRTWNGVWEMLRECWISGIGAGELAFREIYINYAYPGIEAAPHAHSLFLQIIAQCGIVGFILMTVAIWAVMRKGFTCVRSEGKHGDNSIVCLACISGMTALLVAGIFDYTWYNYRVFFVFWALAGLVVAASNISSKESEGRIPDLVCEVDASDTVIILDREKA